MPAPLGQDQVCKQLTSTGGQSTVSRLELAQEAPELPVRIGNCFSQERVRRTVEGPDGEPLTVQVMKAEEICRRIFAHAESTRSRRKRKFSISSVHTLARMCYCFAKVFVAQSDRDGSAAQDEKRLRDEIGLMSKFAKHKQDEGSTDMEEEIQDNLLKNTPLSWSDFLRNRAYIFVPCSRVHVVSIASMSSVQPCFLTHEIVPRLSKCMPLVSMLCDSFHTFLPRTVNSLRPSKLYLRGMASPPLCDTKFHDHWAPPTTQRKTLLKPSSNSVHLRTDARAAACARRAGASRALACTICQNNSEDPSAPRFDGDDHKSAPPSSHKLRVSPLLVQSGLGENSAIFFSSSWLWFP